MYVPFFLHQRIRQIGLLACSTQKPPSSQVTTNLLQQVIKSCWVKHQDKDVSGLGPLFLWAPPF